MVLPPISGHSNYIDCGKLPHAVYASSKHAICMWPQAKLKCQIGRIEALKQTIYLWT